jgi:hypothetical protein
MSILAHPTDQATRNRAFNCRMRNRHYEEVDYAFRALKPIINQQNVEGDRKAWFAAIGIKINRCEVSLETCLEYAQAAIFFGKSEKINLFSKDKRWGILQEEILLVYFLIELQSTMRYILTRIETDKMLQSLDKSIQSQTTDNHDSGFVSNLQKNLTALNEATAREFRDLHTHIEDRFTIGNALFGTLQELQHFY